MGGKGSAEWMACWGREEGEVGMIHVLLNSGGKYSTLGGSE